MPSASLATMNRFMAYFGPNGDLDDALDYLLSLGYKENRGWLTPPMGHGEFEGPKASAAIDYLCEEWDYVFRENGK